MNTGAATGLVPASTPVATWISILQFHDNRRRRTGQSSSTMSTSTIRGIILAGTLALAGELPAADPTPLEQFQQALFEEEANRDLPKAIAGYEEVIRRMDQQRQLAATAVFRLGESYRKLGKTNEAVRAYERIVTEFSDQETLVKLSEQNLSVLRPSRKLAATPDASAPGSVTATGSSELRRLEILLETVRSLEPMSDAELRTLLEFGSDEVGVGSLRSRRHARQQLEYAEERLRGGPESPSLKSQADQWRRSLLASEESLSAWRAETLRMLEARVEAARSLAGNRGAASAPQYDEEFLNRYGLTAADINRAQGGPASGMRYGLTPAAEQQALRLFLETIRQLDVGSRDELAAISSHQPDAHLQGLLAQADQLQTRLSELKGQFGAEHPQVVATQNSLRSLDQQILNQRNAIVAAAEARLAALDRLLADGGSPTGQPGAVSQLDPAARAKQKELLEQELALVQQQLKAVRRQADAGTVPAEEPVFKEREVIQLRRQIVALDPSADSIKRQRELLGQELELIRKLVEYARLKVEKGQGSRNELVELERQMLQLLREDLDLAARLSQSTADRNR
ncbi:MAG TPA: hypothetical protein DCY13_06750 [Verrucomicrobiales bacterium]|nr:hypothetical protein [Verrucomicrobiales bacterium]